MKKTLFLFALIAQAHAADYAALEKSRDWEGMLAQASNSLKANPADQDAVWHLTQAAMMLRGKKNEELAIDAANACLKQDPKAARCHSSLGRVYGVRAQSAGLLTQMRLAPKIKTHFEQAVLYAPALFSARRDLNQFYLAAPSIAGGGVDKAEKNVAEYAKFDPIGGQLMKADLLNAAKKPAEAEAILMAATGYESEELRDAHAAGLIGTGLRHLNEKRGAEAQRVLDFGVALYPDNATLQLVAGRVMLEAGNTDGAIVALEKSLAINDRAGAQYRLGMAYEKKGRNDEARQKYQEFLKLQGRTDSPQAKDAALRLKSLK